MASIGTIFPHNGSQTGSTTAAASTSSSTSTTSSSSGSNSLSNQATFLQLLVAQLQYQDPTQPMDGTTFVTQLATFSDLQENTGTRQDLDGISQAYLGTIPSQSTGSTSSTATTTSSTSPVTGG